MSSYLSIVDRCDNFRLETTTEPFAEFRLSPSSTHIIGLVSRDVLAALEKANESADSHVWNIRKGSETTGGTRGVVTFNDSFDTPEKRTQALKVLIEGWRDAGLFSNAISPRLWRDELYAVYIDEFGPRTEDNLAFVLERSACALFGLVTYGVHMTMYTQDWKVWVPTRAKSKQTWPLCLDNTVAGGVPHGLSIFESLVKESTEEANLDESLVRAHAKPTGALSLSAGTRCELESSPKGYLQPEIEFVYDLLIPQGQEELFTPQPLDGEVDSFKLEELDKVIPKMHEGLFKPNCALVLLDFLIRHGKVTPENEPNYTDITTRMHGRFGYEL